MWRRRFSKRSYSIAMGLGLALLIGTTGCVRLTHHLTRHTPVHELKRNDAYYHCPYCGQVIDLGNGHQCAVQLPYHGFQPTCWMPWPAGYPGCPTIVGEKSLPAEVLPGAVWEEEAETSQQLPAGSLSTGRLADAGRDATTRAAQPPRNSVQARLPQPGNRFRQLPAIVVRESLEPPMVQPSHLGQQADPVHREAELAEQTQAVTRRPSDEAAISSDRRNDLVAEQPSAEQPSAEQPSAEQPSAEQPSAEQPSQVDPPNAVVAAPKDVSPKSRAAKPARKVSVSLAEAVARWLPDSTSAPSSQAAEVQDVPEALEKIAQPTTNDSPSSEADEDSTPVNTSIAEYFEVVIPVPRDANYTPAKERIEEEVADEVRLAETQPAREDKPDGQALPQNRNPARRPTLVESLLKLRVAATDDSSRQ